MPYKVGDIEVLQREAASLDSPLARYDGLQPGTTTLPAGYQKTPAHRPFVARTIFERDIAIPLRDGKILRADIYRPESSGPEKVPALVAWSPYGKSDTGFFNLGIVPGRVGVAQSRLSGCESFEGPDPAEWTARGYAIVNVNARGAFDSEGDIRWWGSGEGRDGYDAIEHLATLPWCTGKIALVGNSWLAMAQWHIAAERPPHLTCIAPLEGSSDAYRETICRGGVPNTPFVGFVASMLFGRNKQEDIVAMLQQHPFADEYWEDKRAKIEKINIPAYVLASYSTGLHTVGSFRGFEELATDKKWLRVHPTQEWHDLYSEACVEDLQRYFDHFLKLKDNGWEKTPRVRLATVGFNSAPQYNHPFETWPIPQTDLKTFFLSKDQQLVSDRPSSMSTLSYQSDVPSLQMDADTEGELSFEYTFPGPVHMIGYPKATLYMSCPDHDDMDVFVQLRKANKDGKVLQNINIPLNELQLAANEVVTVNTNKYIGPTGILRASRRRIDEKRSKPHWPLHEHLRDEKVTPGEVVKLEIGLWPCGMHFEAAEKLIFKVAGHHMTLAEFEPLRGKFTADNKGKHVLHIGGQYPSEVLVPFVKI